MSTKRVPPSALYQVLGWQMNKHVLPNGKEGVKVTLSIIFIPKSSFCKNIFQVTVKLGRNILSSLMVEFLPTLLMNMINQVVNHRF